MAVSHERKTAVILFAHGARDPRWAEPFVRVLERVRRATPRHVELAYLEFLKPDLREAAAALAADGVTAIRVVPLFFGRGGHLRESVPQLITATAEAMPGLTFELAEPAGDDDAVIDAIAAFCVRQIDDPM